VYDGQGRLRVKRDYVWSSGYGWYPTGETRYLYDLSAAQAGGLLLVLERNSANTPTVTYTRGRDLSGSLAGAGGIGGLLARSHGYSGGNWTSHTAYHADGNGNVTALANSAGALQASYRYDPYGRYLAGGGPLASANGLRFSSKPWVGFAGSATSGLYYYGYRFYDPYLQRWVNRDPANEPGFQMLTDQFRKGQIHDLQLHLFVKNNPISNWDYLGLDNPGCDLPSWLQPSGANKDCYLRCCAQHDACYYRNDCTAASWGFNVAEVAGTLAGGPVGHGIAAACLIFSKCAGCNNEVMGCFARCASGIKPPRGPRWFCPNGKHAGEWYDDWDKIPADCWETGKKPDHP
jgi:RHS repeat-associated protein